MTESKQFAKKGMGNGTIQESSQIKAIFYDPENKILKISFHSSASYQYLNVPEEVWNKALESKSIGSFVSSNIKGVYSYSKFN